MIDWTIVGSILAVSITAGGTWLASKVQHKGRPENALIDQLQEEVGRHGTRIKDLETEQGRAKKRERIRDDYINRLRRHIEEGMPPPPPPWPEGLND